MPGVTPFGLIFKPVFYLTFDRPAETRQTEEAARMIVTPSRDADGPRAGGYAALFSRRARLYRERGLHEQSLAEEDLRRLLLEHYTFLSRPVVEVDGKVFVGSGKKAVEGAVRAL